MILEEFALLASDTARTKAYLQAMIREEKLPGICVVYSDNIVGMKEEAEKYQGNNESEKYFDRDTPILFSLNEANIHYIYEPYTRSKVLIKALNQYLEQGTLVSYKQNQDGAETYFIIHPVLKYLAIMGIEKGIS